MFATTKPPSRFASRRAVSGALLSASITVLAVAAGSAASAHEPPDDQPSLTAEPGAARPVAMRWLSSGVVPATDDATVPSVEPARPSDDRTDAAPGVAAADATSSAASTTDVLAAFPHAAGGHSSGGMDELVDPAPADGGSTPIPLDDIISNYGCMMVEPEPGEHQGVNCIDDGWLNTDGTVYVHTAVPAAHQVRFSSSPPSGTDDGVPHFDTFDLDSSPGYTSHEFTSKPFDIVPAQTYHILAMAWDSSGNMAWRYGTATVPYTAHAVIDKITILNDGDEGSLNKGEIRIDLDIGDETWAFPEKKRDDGDSFDPGAEHTVSNTGPTLRIAADALEDDPGECVLEYSGLDVPEYEDGGGCHYAKAVEFFDLTTGQPTLDVDFTSPDEHLRIRIEGHITVSLP